jgi:hypothetical protein
MANDAHPFFFSEVFMTIDLIQLLYYAGFAVLGWYLRHRGIALPSNTPAPAPSNGPDQTVLLDLLKALLDRLSPPPSPPQLPIAGNVVHVPIEVAANVKQPSV